jgi:acetyltransferase-like isoleucine patch superfamily enzyme
MSNVPQADPRGIRFHEEPFVSPAVEIGRYTYHGNDLQLKHWVIGEKIVIGSFCSIAHRVTIHVGGGHGAELVSTYPFDYFLLRRPKPHRTYRTTPPTVIGNDVWIGAGATVLSGIHVGDGAIIGSCAVVASDVPPYAVVAGNPARTIRFRFRDEIIAALLRIEWWNWPIEVIHQRVEWFYQPIERFVAEFDPQATDRLDAPHGLGRSHLTTNPAARIEPTASPELS